MKTLITKGFHHITMVAEDAPRTLAFYGGLLGLPMVKQTVNFDDPGAYHLYFGDEAGSPGTILTFFEWPQARRGGFGVGGIHHLALGVETSNAQLMWKRRLTDAGVAVSGPFDRGYFSSIYFSDPDGQVLEIATQGPGYAIDEPAHALGQRLIEPDPARLAEGRDEGSIRELTFSDPVPEVSEGMRLRGIHHISGITDDLGRAGEFYEAALGLKLVKKTLNQDDGKTEHLFWANYDGETVGPNSSLTLFGWPGSTHRARPGTGQTHHLAFRAPTDEDHSAWRDHLVSMGIQVSPVMDRKYFRSIYFNAPDGLLLEIATDGPGFSVDEEPQALGKRLQLPSWLEDKRLPIQESLKCLAPDLEGDRPASQTEAASKLTHPPEKKMGPMLEFMRRGPPDPADGDPVLVLLHGRGSDMGDLQGLAQVLPSQGTLLTPQAPHPGGPWGYGPGWAWYRYLGQDHAEPESLAASMRSLEAFLDDVPRSLGFQPGPLVLGGFSQGGTTSLAYACTHPGAVAGVVNLSGFLVSPRSLPLDLESLGETPLFWGHGTQDPAVPFSLALSGRERLRGAGKTFEARDYPMGHWVAPEEMVELKEWLEMSIPGWGG